MEINYKRLAGVLMFVLLALVSLFFMGNEDSLFEYTTIIKIDERINDALSLSGGSAITSVLVTLLPDDVATPVAQKIADLTSYFLIAVLFLYTEKFLMTIFGIGIFKIIIPLGCIAIAVLQYKNNEEWKHLILKIIAFGLVLFLSIPISIFISDTIYSRNREKIEQVLNTSATITEDTDEQGETKGIWKSITERISGVTARFTNRISALFHSLVDILAIAIVSSCIIPLLTVVILIWILNKLFGLKVQIPRPFHSRRNKNRPSGGDLMLPEKE